FRQDEVQRVRTGRVARQLVAERYRVEAAEQMLARAEQHGTDRQVHLVDQASFEVLTNRRDAAAEPDVLAVGSLAGPIERFADAARNEVKGGSAVHRNRLSRVVSQHEHRRVVRGIVPPPAAPALVGPRSANRAEHVAAEDPRADVRESLRGEVVVDARRAAALAVRLLKGSRRNEPLVQRFAADAEWVLESLV